VAEYVVYLVYGGWVPGWLETRTGALRCATLRPSRRDQLGRWAALDSVETGVQTLYDGLGIILMLGGVVAADVEALQGRIGKQEKELGEYKLYVAERYASKEYLSETKREILDSIRDLARRIEHP